jgi:hypothetical protein
VDVTTDGTGDATFSQDFSNTTVKAFAQQGAQIVATATSDINNTSEFSDPVTMSLFLKKPIQW